MVKDGETKLRNRAKVRGPNGPDTVELAERLGGGAFGEVYAAVNTETGARYAIKFPRSSLLAGDTESLAFKNDLLAAGKVKHANVVEVVWASADTQPPYLIMERVDGGTLMAELRRRRAAGEQLPAEQIKRWFENLIDGVEAINKVLLHRDIKPDNILISDSVLKITDFGLAKLVDAATRSQTFKEAGALAYLAPEAWLGESNEIQRDMYALGLTMFEITTLEYGLTLPSEGLPDLWKEIHLYGEPKRLSEFRSDLPSAVEQILLRLVAKRPHDRFSSWEQVRATLDAAWTSKEAASSSDLGLGDEIVRAVTASREARQAAAAKEDRAARRAAEISKAAWYQWERLLDDVETALREVQKIGSVTVQRKDGRLVVSVDGRRVADASLFWINPEHRFRKGTVTNAVASFSTACRKGFNAILRRDDENDLHGKWVGVGWGRNALFFLGRTVDRKPEPFALDQQELKKHFNVLDGVTSDLQTKRISDIPGSFMRFLAECIKQMI